MSALVVSSDKLEQRNKSNENQQFTVVVPAAGVGKRMLTSCPKQYLTINNETILSHTVNRLLSHKSISKVVLVLSDDDDYFEQTALVNNPNIIRVSGGKERVDSVLNGLQQVNALEWVLVHDAARPCVTHDDISKLIDHCLNNNNGGILAAPVVDTMKLANNTSQHEAIQVNKTIERNLLWHAYTPQMFKANTLIKAIEHAQLTGLPITDEASAIESLSLPCSLVSGRRDNIKITRPEDLTLASFYLEQQRKLTTNQKI
ncbi:2-C-methyl-D-erythritol 4-phosphate cytidylyltransferase [Colwellia sp. E150_009]